MDSLLQLLIAFTADDQLRIPRHHDADPRLETSANTNVDGIGNVASRVSCRVANVGDVELRNVGQRLGGSIQGNSFGCQSTSSGPS